MLHVQVFPSGVHELLPSAGALKVELVQLFGFVKPASVATRNLNTEFVAAPARILSNTGL